MTCAEIQDLNADEGMEAASTIYNLQQAVDELKQQRKVDAILYKSAVYSIDLMHKRIAKLQHQVSGLKGSITKKNKVIAQLRQAIHVSGV
jgi:uncharacterized small protein (DUF1192 family)